MGGGGVGPTREPTVNILLNGHSIKEPSKSTNLH